MDAHIAVLPTPLDGLHRRLGARMVTFAGYAMPVHYRAGILAEHLACRAGAALFDVSHMGQATLTGADAARYLETLMPGDILGLRPGRQRYSFFTAADGGIGDDLMVSCIAPESYFLVVNASRKAEDFALLRRNLPTGLQLEIHADRALIALQGPAAASLLPHLADRSFMSVAAATIAGIACLVCRSGYTGEDGFEISCPAAYGEHLAEFLLADPICQPAGLGARDTLRLEAGLCLYGNDIDDTTNPVEADLAWTIGKRRRMQGGYPGAAAIAQLLADGPCRLRVGIRPDGRAPARAGTPILTTAGARVGEITSGGFGPTVGGPIAMGYVDRACATDGTDVVLMVRDRGLPARIVPLPFVPHRYRR